MSRKMTDFLAISIAEGMDDPQDDDEYLKAWQYIADTGLYHQLQGWFGRTLKDLINGGQIRAPKDWQR